jgi:hypothetical protein
MEDTWEKDLDFRLSKRSLEFFKIHNKAFNHRNYGSKCVVLGYNSTYFSNKIQKGKTCYSEEQMISMLEFLIDNIWLHESSYLLQDFEEIPTHMSIKINRLEEGHSSYPLVCRRPAETVPLQSRHICYRWGTPAYWSFVPRKLCSLGNILVSFSHVSSIKTFDFSTLYTILPHDKLKARLRETTHKAFSHRNYGSKCGSIFTGEHNVSVQWVSSLTNIIYLYCEGVSLLPNII